MKTILSTKKLSLSQKELLLNAGVSFVEYDAIKVDSIPFEVPKCIQNAIFTSQNAVRSFCANVPSNTVENYFCVGKKTKSLLEEKGQKVVKKTQYASELADYILKNHKNESFYFFCGNIRSDEVPLNFKENKIAFEEITVYQTTINPKKFERKFDAIMFFSPSGVKSFFDANNPSKDQKRGLAEQLVAVCIGSTTAFEAKRYSENVVIANATTIESVIAKAIKILKT